MTACLFKNQLKLETRSFIFFILYFLIFSILLRKKDIFDTLLFNLFNGLLNVDILLV